MCLDILNKDRPYNLEHVLKKLITATDILLKDHNYDGHGWEELVSARDEAHKIIKKISITQQSLSGYEPKGSSPKSCPKCNSKKLYYHPYFEVVKCGECEYELA